ALLHHAQHALLGQCEDPGRARACGEEIGISKNNEEAGMVNKSGLMVLGVAALAALSSLSPLAAQNANQNWVAAWSTSQQGLSETKLSNATVRLIARVTIPGDAVRI